MKKIVFLLFVCLNLFAQEVYDLRDSVEIEKIKLFLYPKSDKQFKEYVYANDRNNSIKTMLPKEYEELLKIEDVIDRDDKANELIKKVKAMIASPKIGDKIKTGNHPSNGVSIRYEDGKLKAYVMLLGAFQDDSTGESLNSFDITFLPTTKEVLKELANSISNDYRIEVIGTISKIEENFVKLKDLKIKIFTKENKQIEIIELSAIGDNKSIIAMEYK
jgi:hypothetical protein